MTDDDLIEQPKEGVLEVIPFGCEGSVIPGVVADRSKRWRPTLFIGGPLDGQHIRVPADGRLYDLPLQAVADENGDIDIDISLRRYVPSFVTFDGRRMMVYLYLNHLREYHNKCLNAERQRQEALPVEESAEMKLIERSKKRLGIEVE